MARRLPREFTVCDGQTRARATGLIEAGLCPSRRGLGWLVWLIGVAIGAVVLSACASASSARPGATTASPDFYQVGPLRVLLRPQPEVEFLCRLRAQHQAMPNGRVLGCYEPSALTIISTPDPGVLLHELKHYFEGPFHD